MMNKFYITLLSVALLGCTESPEGASLSLKEIGTMPAYEQGFEQGVSACYAAEYNDTLYIAGGCNFPDKPAAEGGSKRYYKGIYKAAIGDTLTWSIAASLPSESAYGASVQADGRWIVAGGMNSEGASAQVLSIAPDNGCHIEMLPSLPCTVDNTAASVANGILYVVGGNCDGKPSNRVFALDLDATEKGWSELPAMPSRARVQPVCAATDEALYVWGGFCTADENGDAVTHSDGVRYIFGKGEWEQLPPIHIAHNEECAARPAANDIFGNSITLSGGTAALLDDYTIIAAGGVNKEIFTDAISGRYTLTSKEQYMHHNAEWYRFNPCIMLYSTKENSWQQICREQSFARAGATMIKYRNGIIYVGGELKPGIRTPQINLLQLKK